MPDPPATESPTSRVAEARQAAAAVKTEAASVGETGGELVSMVIAYAKQETIDPLKALARFVGWGLFGAVLIAVGWFFLVLAAVRALQFEAAPHLDGHWSWVPYMGGALVAVFGAVLAAWRIGKGPQPRGGR